MLALATASIIADVERGGVDGCLRSRGVTGAKLYRRPGGMSKQIEFGAGSTFSATSSARAAGSSFGPPVRSLGLLWLSSIPVRRLRVTASRRSQLSTPSLCSQ